MIRYTDLKIGDETMKFWYERKPCGALDVDAGHRQRLM